MASIIIQERRVENFAEKKVWKCLHCGKDIDNPTDLYSRRFCSIDCKETYCSPIKTI